MPNGLWLESSAAGGGELRLVATSVHREVLECGPDVSGPQSTTLSRWCPRWPCRVRGASDDWHRVGGGQAGAVHAAEGGRGVFVSVDGGAAGFCNYRASRGEGDCGWNWR